MKLEYGENSAAALRGEIAKGMEHLKKIYVRILDQLTTLENEIRERDGKDRVWF